MDTTTILAIASSAIVMLSWFVLPGAKRTQAGAVMAKPHTEITPRERRAERAVA